jgi:hypothetical protein
LAERQDLAALRISNPCGFWRSLLVFSNKPSELRRVLLGVEDEDGDKLLDGDVDVHPF